MLFERITPPSSLSSWEIGDKIAMTVHPGEQVFTGAIWLPVGRHEGTVTETLNWKLAEVFFERLNMVVRFTGDGPIVICGGLPLTAVAVRLSFERPAAGRG